MKVEVLRDKLLSNYEVYSYLLDLQRENGWSFTLVDEDQTKSNKKKKKKRTTNSLIDLEIITRDLSGYLSKHHQSQTTNPDTFIEFMRGLNKFELEKIEKLQIVNFLPRTLVTLYSLIEECDQRFTEEQINEILELVNTFSPAQEEEEEEEENYDGEADAMEGVEGQEEAAAEEDLEEEAFEIVQDELEHETYGKGGEDPKEIDE